MTFKQWINDFDTVSDDIRHVVLHPDFRDDLIGYKIILDPRLQPRILFLCLGKL